MPYSDMVGMLSIEAKCIMAVSVETQAEQFVKYAIDSVKVVFPTRLIKLFDLWVRYLAYSKSPVAPKRIHFLLYFFLIFSERETHLSLSQYLWSMLVAKMQATAPSMLFALKNLSAESLSSFVKAG